LTANEIRTIIIYASFFSEIMGIFDDSYSNLRIIGRIYGTMQGQVWMSWGHIPLQGKTVQKGI